MANLILLRHGQSEWNESGRFTGQTDVDLSPKGREEARAAGVLLQERNLLVDVVFSSSLKRAVHTAYEALEGSAPLNNHLKNKDGTWDITCTDAFMERHYGQLTGMLKDEAKETFGKDQIKTWKYSYDQGPPDGESLADVVARAGLYFDRHVRPLLDSGQNVLIAAHHHALRALFLHVGKFSVDNVSACDIKTGEVVILPWPII